MTGLQLIVLALVQGITEFLPISSEAHLIIADRLFGWPDAGRLIRVAVHVGTLGAVIIYFRRDVWTVVIGFFRLLGGQRGRDSMLALYLIVATLPAVAAGGLAVHYGIIDELETIEVIAWSTLIFAVLLYAADRFNLTILKLGHFTIGHALFIGVAQALALVPGTSRSGITMTAARALGYERIEAARFSMLLSIPIILVAGGYEGYALYQKDDLALTIDVGIAALLAFLAALPAIGLMMAWLRWASFTPFVLYRIALGGVLLWWAYGPGL